jgi:hypothetical protein
MERREHLQRRDERIEPRRRYEESPTGIGIGSIVGGIVLLGVAALVIVSLPDIKRYIKISTM